MYGELIPRFADCIGRERILILFSSELRKSPDQTLRKALEFLGQEHLGIDIGDKYKYHKNSTSWSCDTCL